MTRSGRWGMAAAVAALAGLAVLALRTGSDARTGNRPEAGAEASPETSAEGPDPCTEDCPRPDALIRRRNEAFFFGDDVQNLDAAGQTQVAMLTREGTVRFVVRLENDGATADDLVIQGSRNTEDFGIRYFIGGEEISTRVRFGVYRYEDLAPGEFGWVRVEVTAKRAAVVGDVVEALLTVRSATDPVAQDVVRAVVYRHAGGESPIVAAGSVSRAQAERWARGRGATGAFQFIARFYWELAPERGIAPEVAYAQAAKETAFGHFGGVIDATWRNPCGLKTAAGGDDGDPEAHQRFDTWRQGVTACIDHLALYGGAPGYPSADTPDPRHFPHLLGTAPTVERLGARWAPDPGYGRSVALDFLRPLVATP